MNNMIMLKIWGQQMFLIKVVDEKHVRITHKQWNRFVMPNVEEHRCMNANSAKYGQMVSSYSGGYTAEYEICDHDDKFDELYPLPASISTNEELVEYVVEVLEYADYAPKRKNGISWEECGEELPRKTVFDPRTRTERWGNFH